MKEHTRKYIQKNTRNTRKAIKQKRTINDYQFFIGTNKQASEFENASEFIINYIKRTFERGNDIAESLRTLKLHETDNWMPTLKMSNSNDKEIKMRENRQFELEYKAKLDESIKRVDKYQQNIYKSYAFLWEKCSRALQNKLLGRKDFDTKIYNDPIQLLTAIKEHSLNFQESRYEMKIITESIKNFFFTRQKDTESLQEYTRRFKSAKEIMESHIGGPIKLDKYIELSEEYKSDMKQYEEDIANKIQCKKPTTQDKKYIKKAASKLYAFIYIDNADKNKYESLLKNLNQQYSLGNNQYPTSITEANGVLNNHKFDDSYTKSRMHGKSQKSNEQENDNEKEQPLLLTFAQVQGKCYCCGKSGHRSTQCKLKDKIPKEDWYINNVQLTQTNKPVKRDMDTETATTQNTFDTNTDSTISTKSTHKRIGWSNLHYNMSNCQTNKHKELRELVLLDSDSTNTIFCNENYVSNIQNAETPLEIQTNGGILTITQTCEIPHLGKHWFNKDAITNIISLADLSEKHRITMDTAKERSMTVHLNGKKVKFMQMPGGLYARNPNSKEQNNENKINKSDQNYLTVNENEEYMSNRQLKKAKEVKQLQSALGMPSFKDMRAIITMNLIKDNTISHQDISLAEDIFGKSIGEIKGKTTRINMKKDNSETIIIPEELIYKNKDLELSIDTMHVNGLIFLTSISHELYFRTAQPIPSRNKKHYITCMKELLNIYRFGEFNIKTIHCDQEFKYILHEFAIENNINLICAPSQTHVPRAERNIRTIKERIRSLFHSLPYRGLPKTIMQYLVVQTTSTLNYFPARYGLSRYYSPRMILQKKLLNFNTHCKHYTGEYVLAHDDKQIKNNMESRAIDCIYLRPANTSKYAHEFYNIATKKVIVRQNCTSIPTPAHIINIIEKQAQEDKLPMGITFKPIDPSNNDLWLAGVEDNLDNEHNSNDETNTNEISIHETNNMDINEVHEILNQPSDFHTPNTDHKAYIPTTDNNNMEQNIQTTNNTPDIFDEHLLDQIFTNPEEEIVFNYDEIDEDELEETDDQNINTNMNQDNNKNLIVNEDDITQPNMNAEEHIDIEEQDDNQSEIQPNTRTRQPNRKYQDFYQFIMNQETNQNMNMEIKEYSNEDAQIIATFLQHKITNQNMGKITGVCNTNTYSLNKGILKYGYRGKKAVDKELSQLHNRQVFKPVRLSELTQKEKQRAMNSLIFLTEKRDGTIKARACANGSTQRSYIEKHEAASPTVSTEALLTTAVIDAKQNRDIITLDIPNAFVQTPMPKSQQRVIMRINGLLVEYLDKLFPGEYNEYIINQNNTKILYVEMEKALYGMMLSSLLFYKHFRKDLESIGFVVNPYDICVANRKINGHQQTITWHVDDVKASHKSPHVNQEFYKWCEKKYGSELNGHVKMVSGKIHDYLAMKLDYSNKGKLKVDMKEYVKEMIKDYPSKTRENIECPWSTKLFNVNDNSKSLNNDYKELFHTFVMKCMFLGKRARPDILMGISFLSTRVLNPNEEDWKKLNRIMSYLNTTKEIVLCLEADNEQKLQWYVDASFGTHKDMKSHTGSMFTLGKGAIWNESTKQKVNARSSTEAELISIDDKISKIIWMRKFIEAQGFEIDLNILYQDNMSTIKLAENGKQSSGKRTRHFDIKYFYVTDLINRNEVSIEYCSSNDMLADFHTKPLIGEKFKLMRNKIMNMDID